ncbi:MAG: phytanoyl-CoA dioxygenase family protein [Candidatus Latescibacterota bacterium]|nr:phytanoyl-CoA dioxygenase family protein [Candidatus Latescibacterota bacterium]
MTDLEKYLFDLNGFLVIEDALTADEVAQLNTFVDEHADEVRLEGGKSHQGGFLTWGQAFVDLLDHASIMPRLKFILGDGFRLDHYYAIYADKGAERLGLHGANTPYDPPEYYHFRDGRMYNGLTVVSWQLTDSGPDCGGFCCVPGSHKANWPLPQEIKEQHIDSDCVSVAAAKTGSVVIFTEALTHGSAPWIADHQRRSLLCKYSPGQQSWSTNHIQPPTGLRLTERQQLLFEPPYFHARPSLFEA